MEKGYFTNSFTPQQQLQRIHSVFDNEAIKCQMVMTGQVRSGQVKSSI
jgi:hypothetical protein